MSFQDVGRTGQSKRLTNDLNNPSSGPSIGAISAVGSQISNNKDGNFADLSNAILQYQKNVGILEAISRNVGTSADGVTLETQLKVQIDVLKQLAAQIDRQIRGHEGNLETMPRTEGTRHRATLVKLTRDYHRVEMTYKNIVLETRRKRSLMEARRREEDDNENRKKLENEFLDDSMKQLQIQQQNDRIAEEIIREREAEIRNINRGMHQVNEIYKDLAHLVGSQQEQIDQVETHMENASRNAEQGFKQIEKANAASDSSCIIS